MGLIEVTVKQKLKEFEGLREDIETAVQRAVIDTKKVAAGRVADAVRERYNIKKSEINSYLRGTGSGQVNVEGYAVAHIALTYRSTRLIPSAGKVNLFNLTPGQREAGAKKTKVRAQIIKGQRKVMHSQAFIGTNHYGSNLPFQRKGDARLPVTALHTLSVPQMVENEEVNAKYMQEIQEKLMHSLELRLSKVADKRGK